MIFFRDTGRAREVIERKDSLRDLARRATERCADGLVAGEPKRVLLFRIESNLIDQFSRLFYHVRRIAKVMTKE